MSDKENLVLLVLTARWYILEYFQSFIINQIMIIEV